MATELDKKSKELRARLWGEEAIKSEYLKEFDEKFATFLNEQLFGAIWNRPGLPTKTRSLITVTALMAPSRQVEGESHGFIALGDAACVFNPNQGQGMSVVAAEAVILRDCVKHTSSPELLPRRFVTAQAEFQINPWRLAVCNDLRFSYVQGRHTPSVRFFNWYRQRIALTADRDVQRRIAEVEGLLRPVTSLFEAAIARRVLALWIRSARYGFNEANAQFSPMPPTFAEGR